MDNDNQYEYEILPQKIFEIMRMNTYDKYYCNELDFISLEYISSRNRLFSLLHKISKRMDFNSRTYFLSIYYLDLLFIKHHEIDCNYNLLALSCLVLSAKYCENDPLVPHLRYFILVYNDIVGGNNKISVSELFYSEVITCKMLDYKLNYFTIYDFDSFIFLYIIIKTEQLKEINIVSSIGEVSNSHFEINVFNSAFIRRILAKIYKKSRYYLELIIKNPNICLKYNSLLISIFIMQKSIEEILYEEQPDIKRREDFIKITDKNFQEIMHMDVNNIGQYKDLTNDKELIKIINDDKKRNFSPTLMNIEKRNLTTKSSNRKLVNFSNKNLFEPLKNRLFNKTIMDNTMTSFVTDNKSLRYYDNRNLSVSGRDKFNNLENDKEDNRYDKNTVKQFSTKHSQKNYFNNNEISQNLTNTLSNINYQTIENINKNPSPVNFKKINIINKNYRKKKINGYLKINEKNSEMYNTINIFYSKENKINQSETNQTTKSIQKENLPYQKKLIYNCINNNNTLNENGNAFHINTTINKESVKNSFSINPLSNKDENPKYKSLFHKLKFEGKNVFNRKIQDDLIIKIDENNQSLIVNKLLNSTKNGLHKNNLIKLNKEININQNLSKDVSRDEITLSEDKKNTLLNSTRNLKKFTTITADKFKKKIKEIKEDKNNEEDKINKEDENLNSENTKSSKHNENKKDYLNKGMLKLKINFSKLNKKAINDINNGQINTARSFKIALTNNILKEENNTNKYVKYTRYHKINKLNDDNNKEENNNVVYENEKNVSQRNTITKTKSNSKIKKISKRIQGIRRKYINKTLNNKDNSSLNGTDNITDTTIENENKNNNKKIINKNENNNNDNTSSSIFSILHQTRNLDNKKDINIISNNEDINVNLSKKAFYKSLAFKNKIENEQKEKEKSITVSSINDINENQSIKNYYCRIKEKNNKENNLKKSIEPIEIKQSEKPSTIVINNNININFGNSRNYINKSITSSETGSANSNRNSVNNKLANKYKTLGMKRTYTNSNVTSSKNTTNNTSCRIRVNKNINENNNKADNSVSNLLHKLQFYRKTLDNSNKKLKREFTNLVKK